MAGFYDSASNDFNTAINNYKNNVGSVAQQQIQGDIGQVSNAKDLLMEKAGILAGGEESSISDKIQSGMSKTMDELGLDMSVHTIGGKVLPWVAKKLKGKFKNMREDREQARRNNSEQTRDELPESQGAGGQDLTDLPNNDTSSLPRGGRQGGAGARDEALEQPNTGAREINPATNEEIDPNARVQQNQDQQDDDVLDENGRPMQDESERVQRQREDQAGEDRPGINRFGGEGEVGSGLQDSVGGDLTDLSGGLPTASIDQVLRSPNFAAGKSGSVADEFAKRQSNRGDFTAEQEASLRGPFDAGARDALEGRANVSGRTGPASRPDEEVDGISAEARDAMSVPSGATNLNPDRILSREDFGALRDATESGGLTGNISIRQAGGRTAGQRQAAADDQAQIQRERQSGADRSAQESDISTPRAPVRDPYSSSSRPTDIASEEQMTSSGALRDLQAQAATEARSTTSTIGDYEATFTEKAAGAAGDFVGFLGDVLGPAAAIFGGVEAARGIHADIKDSLDPNNDPFAQVSKLIGKAQGQQAGMNAAISADQFSSKVGAGRPSFGSLAAPTFDSSSIMQGMGGHF